ncbi:MAG TPA: TRAP transporter small permease [Anaerohalosphaeraceae bacterium]|nr:TRAP transporter small permease [Phycisphaerae bacterium]HOK96987.1 TRAP transporter small permease [Anaerohalosphaeraceae bacterium]HOL32694.1 TRAP transporter small permease [Anaerohalosphaeraceae bacterium]HOM75494.1 TRAP transporter small permease [Anaerohalosphaeraceae bacterium]HPC65379.1 TRAP transporter small permease [Anaerohalosphaeraceae bacterium]
MGTWLRRIKKGLQTLLEWGVIVIMAILVLDVLWGVFSRYVLKAQSRWTEELAIFLLVWVSLLGASVAYASKSHLGVDYFVGKLDRQAQRLAELLVHLAVAVFAASAFVAGGWALVSKTLAAGQISPALGVKMGYVYLAVPISGVFFLIFAAENIAELFAGKPTASAMQSKEN